MLDLLFYADDLELLGVVQKERDTAKLLLYVVARVPFQVGEDERRLQSGVARHGDGVQQLQAWAHQEKGRLASQPYRANRDR